MIYIKRVVCLVSVILSLANFSANAFADPYILAFKTAYQLFTSVQTSKQEMEQTRLLNKELRNIGDCLNSLSDEIHEMRNLELEAEVEGLWGEYIDHWDDMTVNSQHIKDFSYRIANKLRVILKHANSDQPKYAVMLHVPYYSLHSLQLLVEKQMIKVRGKHGEWDNYDKILQLIKNGHDQYEVFGEIYKKNGSHGNLSMRNRAVENLEKLTLHYYKLRTDEHSGTLSESYDFDVNKKYCIIHPKFSQLLLGVKPNGDFFQSKSMGDWEKFSVIPTGDGKYHIKDCHGKFISARDNGTVSTMPHACAWETFSIERLHCGKNENSKLRYKIKSVWGNYVARLSSNGLLPSLDIDLVLTNSACNGGYFVIKEIE